MADKYALIIMCAKSDCANDVMNNKRYTRWLVRGQVKLLTKAYVS